MSILSRCVVPRKPALSWHSADGTSADTVLAFGKSLRHRPQAKHQSTPCQAYKIRKSAYIYSKRSRAIAWSTTTTTHTGITALRDQIVITEIWPFPFPLQPRNRACDSCCGGSRIRERTVFSMVCLADLHSAMDIVGENTESRSVYTSIRANLGVCEDIHCVVRCGCVWGVFWIRQRPSRRCESSAFGICHALAHASGAHYPVLILCILDCSPLPLNRGIHLSSQEL